MPRIHFAKGKIGLAKSRAADTTPTPELLLWPLLVRSGPFIVATDIGALISSDFDTSN